MYQKGLVLINVPDRKVAALEKFLKNLKKEGKLISIRKHVGGEICEITKSRTRRFKSNYYEVMVRGGNEEIQQFIRSLFENNLIPEGKRWTIYGPISGKYLRKFLRLRQ